MDRTRLFAIALPAALVLLALAFTAWRAMRARAGSASEPLRRERVGWEMINGVVALVVGVLALGVTSYTAYLQRRQAQAAVWPRVRFDYSTVPSFRYLLQNKGVGPAVIKYVEVRVRDRPVKDWHEVLAVLEGEDRRRPHAYSTMHNLVLTPGESEEVFSTPDEGLASKMYEARMSLQFTICYCSIFDECWMHTSEGEADPVDACPAPGPSSFED